MNHRYFNLVASISALIAGGAMLAPVQALAQQQQAVEELTRGPIHEAFAGSVSFNPEPGILVQTAPPEMVEEIPPEQRLEGDNVTWIPGYWAWDEEQNDFIWISGIWRKLPPGRQWNPGYWGQVESQWQWTSGYWADEDTQEVVYLPRPPKSLESGPNRAAPSANDIWISGNWVHREDRYAWTPGYWEPAQENWNWIPAHYQWTRRGYVFVDGYWDYNVARRGVMFAPVRFHGDDYRRPGYSYTPLLAVSLNVLMDHLFVRPNYGHYYFGDYYSPRYRNDGYYASYSYSSGRRGYDPIYVHNRWEHRNDRDWEGGRIKNFNYYRDHENDRPARTWAALQNRPAHDDKDKRNAYAIAQPLSRYAERKDSGQRFQSVSKKNRDQYIEERKQIRDFSQTRRQMENRPLEQQPKGSDKRDQVIREKLAKSPVVGKRAEQLTGNDVPPKRLSPRASQYPARDAADHPQKGDKPGKTATDGKRNPEKDIRPDGQRGKGAKTDILRPEEPKANPQRPRKPEADPRSGKGEENSPSPERVIKPEREQKMKPQPKREPVPSERRKADVPSQPKIEPQVREKTETAPDRRSQVQPKREPVPSERRKADVPTQPKRQLEPPRQAKPEKRQDPKPEPTAVPQAPRQPRDQAERKGGSREDLSNKEKKDRKK